APPVPGRPTKVAPVGIGSRRSDLLRRRGRCQDGAMASTSTASTDREALITGDAVLLDLRTACFAVRMGSAAIDGALQLAILIGGVALAWTAARADLDEGLIAAAVLVMSVTAYVGYPVLSELLLRGRSVGRLVMGTRVVRD